MHLHLHGKGPESESQEPPEHLDMCTRDLGHLRLGANHGVRTVGGDSVSVMEEINT